MKCCQIAVSVIVYSNETNGSLIFVFWCVFFLTNICCHYSPPGILGGGGGGEHQRSKIVCICRVSTGHMPVICSCVEGGVGVGGHEDISVD